MDSFIGETGISLEDTTGLAELMHYGEDKAFEQDKKLIVRFYEGSIKNDAETLKQGRPIYDSLEKVRILKIGERDYIDKGANELYRKRFAKQYAAFKSGAAEKQSGTPLAMWPLVKPSQVQEFAHFNVKTIEQLAEMPDIHLQKFMGGNALRQAAREYVSRATSQAPLIAVQAELAGRDAKIAQMQAEMERMSAIMAGLQAQQGVAPAKAEALPEGVVPYRGPDVGVGALADAVVPMEPLAATPLIAPVVAPKRKAGRPPKASTATTT